MMRFENISNLTAIESHFLVKAIFVLMFQMIFKIYGIFSRSIVRISNVLRGYMKYHDADAIVIWTRE